MCEMTELNLRFIDTCFRQIVTMMECVMILLNFDFADFKFHMLINTYQGSCFPLARGHPNGRRASQSHILDGPVGQP